MPLSASTCLQGVYCISRVDRVTSDSPNTDVEISQKIAKTGIVTTTGGKMSNSDPSEFELHRKALSLGLFGQEGSIVSGLSLQAPTSKGPHIQENMDRLPSHSLPGISGLHSGESNGSQRNQTLPKPVALPKIPSIKHPFERRAPQIMQREGSGVACDPPLSLTSQLMTPRSKTILDSSSFIGKKLKPGPTGNRWSTVTHPAAATRPNRDPDPRLINATRLVISPKSKADLRHSPRDFYQRKFPHVHLDLESNLQPPAGRNRLLGSKTTQNQQGVSDTIRTTNELFALTRSKTDLMAVEQLINRSTDRIKSTRSWAVSGWMDGMTCNTKKLHQRDLSYCVQ